MLLNELLINEGFPPPLHGDRLPATLIFVSAKETINFCQLHKDNGCSPQMPLCCLAYLGPIYLVLMAEPA